MDNKIKLDVKTLEKLPYGFSFYESVDKNESIDKIEVVKVKDLETSSYLVYGSYRPISKVFNPENIII